MQLNNILFVKYLQGKHKITIFAHVWSFLGMFFFTNVNEEESETETLNVGVAQGAL